MKNKKIVFIHSLNNYSGSTNVLSEVIKGFVKKGYQIELISSRGKGFLSNIPCVNYRYTFYNWTSNIFFTSILLVISQLQVFFLVLFKRNKNTVYYINTITPFGAIIACWLTHKNYVIHVHENMQQKKPLYLILRNVYKWCNRKSIFVSNYLKESSLNCRNGIVIYNSLSQEFLQQRKEYSKQKKCSYKSVLMIASYRKYKGIYEFAELARLIPDYTFNLVLSTTKSDIIQFKKDIGNINNLNIFPLQTNLHPFYSEAKLLLQLSHPESWIETFGLTILEAMIYGIPAIVPFVGGPTELVENGKNGYLVNPHNLSEIKEKILYIMENSDVYNSFSICAFEKAKQFNLVESLNNIETYLFL